MSAALRLPYPAEPVDLGDELPGLCETCRRAPARERERYCSVLCRLFDVALADHAAALVAEPDAPRAPRVVLTRTRLRAVAAVFDAERGISDAATSAVERAAWAEDAAAGLLVAVDPDDAMAAIRRAAGLA